MSSEPPPNRPDALRAAAEQLVEAARSEAGSASMNVGREMLDELGQISSTSSAFKESFDQKINTVCQHTVTLKEEVAKLREDQAKLREDMARRDKLDRLAWAITNAEVNEFKYEDVHTQKSGTICREILLTFRGGYYSSHYLPENASIGIYTEKGKKQFRDQLCAQIRDLTGSNPRVEKMKDGRYVIHYS